MLGLPRTSLLLDTPHSRTGLLLGHNTEDLDKNYTPSHSNLSLSPENLTTGLTFYIRRMKGVTARLDLKGTTTLSVLIETHYTSLPIEQLSTYKHLICIAGSAGISPILAILRARASANVGRTVLYWGCRSPCLVKEIDAERYSTLGIEVQIRVGERWDVADLVRQETSENCGDVVVVVSGPAGMMDDVRRAVVLANKDRWRMKRKGCVRLIEESFSW